VQFSQSFNVELITVTNREVADWSGDCCSQQPDESYAENNSTPRSGGAVPATVVHDRQVPIKGYYRYGTNRHHDVGALQNRYDLA